MKIIVPTDFSDLSNHALDFAAKIAKPLRAQIHILHFEEIPLDDTSLHLSGEAHGKDVTGDTLFNAQLFRANAKNLNS